MAEPGVAGAPERLALRRAVRHALRGLDSSLRVIAEDVLAESSPIDLLGLDGRGGLVTARIGREGSDPALLTTTLSDRVWLRPRLRDWLQIAPELAIDPTAEIRSLLLCPEFQAATRSAVRALAPGAIQLVRYRRLRDRGPLRVELELEKPVAPEVAHESTSEWVGGRPVDAGEAGGRGATERAEPATSSFRTGLSDADLQHDRRPNAVPDSLSDS